MSDYRHGGIAKHPTDIFNLVLNASGDGFVFELTGTPAVEITGASIEVTASVTVTPCVSSTIVNDVIPVSAYNVLSAFITNSLSSTITNTISANVMNVLSASLVDTGGNELLYATGHEYTYAIPTIVDHTQKYQTTIVDDNVTTTTGYMLVDLNGTGAWPHNPLRSHIDIFSYTVIINPDTQFVGKVEFGFLTNVTASHSTFNVIKSWLFVKQSAVVATTFNASPHSFICSTDSWIGYSNTADTTFKDGVAIVGPNGGSYAPENGDAVIKVTRTTGSVAFNIACIYDTSG